MEKNPVTALAQRRLISFLFLWMALLAYVLAPSLTALAAAQMELGIPGLEKICTSSGSQNRSDQVPGQTHDKHECCVVCGFAQLGGPPPQPVILAPVAEAFVSAVWIPRTDRLTHRAFRARAQARAPPFHP